MIGFITSVILVALFNKLRTDHDDMSFVFDAFGKVVESKRSISKSKQYRSLTVLFVILALAFLIIMIILKITNRCPN